MTQSPRTKVATRRRSRPEETVGRDNVLHTALQLFLRHGYAGTSMKALANELGISAPALYWYFPSKEEIFASVLEMALTDFWSAVQKSLTAEEPRARLGEFVRAHVAWQLNQADIARTFDVAAGMRTLIQELPTERSSRIIAIEREYLGELRTILTAGRDQGVFAFDDVKVTAFAITTMCEYVHTWFNPDHSLSVEAVGLHYERLVLAMVGADVGSE